MDKGRNSKRVSSFQIVDQESSKMRPCYIYFFNGRDLYRPYSRAVCNIMSMFVQDALDVAASKKAILPPFQSVLELTSAAAPPKRNEELVTASLQPSSAGSISEA